jgi:hypothetical protein
MKVLFNKAIFNKVIFKKTLYLTQREKAFSALPVDPFLSFNTRLKSMF